MQRKNNFNLIKRTAEIIICWLLMIAGGWKAIAQTSDTSPGKHFLFKNYTTQNGLLHNIVWTMAQDKNGYIWIGSDLGLTRFDGKSFFHKVIPEIYDNSAFVEYIETTPNGNIISTSLMQGVFVQQDDGRFKKYLEKGHVELRTSVFNSVKYCPDGKILVSESSCLYLLTVDSLQLLYNLGHDGLLFATLETDQTSRIWFGGSFGLGVMQLSETGYEPVFLPEFNDKLIVKILFDGEGTLHVATTQGYYRVKWRQPASWDNNYIVEQPFTQLSDVFINHIYFDKEQNLWIPTSTYGVFRTKGDSITLHITQENGLVSSHVECILQDNEGNYWFGTHNGISMIENFDNFAIAQNGIRYTGALAILSDPLNQIWLPSWSELHLLQDDRLIPVNLSGSLIEKSGIVNMGIFQSDMIISNHTGLYQMPITKGTPDFRKMNKIADYPSHNITLLRSLFMDSTGIWIGTENKMYNYANRQFLPVTFNHPDSISMRPTKMMQDRYGYYWYGDYSDGLYRGELSRPDKNTLIFDNITRYKSLDADSAFVTAWIASMDFDKEGNLWFSTLYTGVYKLTLDSSGVVSSQLYSTTNGLLSNVVENITCDDEGRIWLLTEKGINILKKDSTGVETIDKLDMNEGIEGKGLWPLQMDDRLYLLTEEGVYVVQNQLFKEKSEIAPKVFITNILINGVADSKISANSSNIRLAPEQNNLTIEYSAITFRDANDVRYQYKLEGADNDWNVLSERGFVEFASLRPGKYAFKVRAALVGAEVGDETTLSFRILPPYYQTIWFYLLITIGIASLLYTFYKYRMNQVIKMERMRIRIASDLHDDIGSTLSSISLISEMASRTDRETELAKALSKIGVDSRDVLNSMDDIIWSVKPQNDTLSNLTVRLREYAIPVCESKNITFTMCADETISSMKLEMDERRNVFLIIKEAVNNAVKHSGCSLLSVSFVLFHKQLEIKVTDNGCGFDPTNRGLRNGVTNMERRAKQIGAELRIQSEKNNGTTITLKSLMR